MPNRISALVLLLLFLSAALAGCAGRAWNAARGEDSVASYHRYLESHPDSEWASEARARLEMVRIRKNPTRESFQKFKVDHADPALLAELAPFVEETFFGHARARGTAEAYEAFLEDFPSGSFAKRAAGNAVYLRNAEYVGDIEGLVGFAQQHPESDFAAEAQRSTAAVALRNQSGFWRVGVAVQVSAETPGRERVARVFLDRARAAYQRAGIHLVSLPDPSRAAEAGVQAVLWIRHDERAVGSVHEAGTVTQPAILGRTEVTLQRVGQSDATWSDVFEFRAPLTARRDDVSILFSAGAPASFWSDLDGQFFVPVASWDNHVIAREPQSFQRPAVAVEVSGSRAVVLFGDGDFEFFDLGDPSSPVRLGAYDRERDLSRFSGVRIQGDRVAVFGEDGLELVRLDGDATRREFDFGRETVGSPADAVALGETWLAATNRGLLELGADGSSVRTLVQRAILAMDRMGDRVVFTDGTSLYVSTLNLLRTGRIESTFRLGSGFAPHRVRVNGNTAVVVGERAAIWLDLRRPSAPRMLSRIDGNESGRVRDAAVIGGRLFLLGARGLQVADRSGERIVDSVDVQARERVGVSGRHLVMVGENRLQVVDATPYMASTPAQRQR